MPAPESYRNWKNPVRDEVKSCSDRPDEAWAWLSDVYDQSCTRQDLEAKLQDPGKVSDFGHEAISSAHALSRG